MADLIIQEKYPNSLRVNHPDFGDVCKTAYGKGVITDFEVISTDPFLVRSLVKVDVEGVGESDYIPLFYHPKPQYWDDEAGLATDFNAGGKYFEKAWMSFRGGDEVKVMLREGVPVAVVGFYDGVPRVGEDIVKLEANREAAWFQEAGIVKILFQCSKAEIYSTNVVSLGSTSPYSLLTGAVNENGPDGRDLNLATEPIYVHDGGQAAYPWQITYYLQPGEPGYVDPWYIDPETHAPHYDPALAELNAYLVTGNTYYYYKEFFVVVGPVLFIFQVNWVGGDCSNPKDLHPPLSGTTSFSPMIIGFRAALYSEEYLNSIKGMGLTTTEVGARINDVEHSPYFGTEYPNSYEQTWMRDAIIAINENVLNWFQTVTATTGLDKLKFLVSPHNPE